MTYRVRLSTKTVRFPMPAGPDIEGEHWTEPVLYDTDDPDEITRIVADVLAANGLSRAEIVPVMK